MRLLVQPHLSYWETGKCAPNWTYCTSSGTKKQNTHPNKKDSETKTKQNEEIQRQENTSKTTNIWSEWYCSCSQTWACSQRIVTKPLTVVRKVGQNTYLLSDGCKWNVSKLTHFPKQALTDTEQNNDTLPCISRKPQCTCCCHYCVRVPWHNNKIAPPQNYWEQLCGDQF